MTMRRLHVILFFLLLPCIAAAQTQGTLPDAIDAANDSIAGGTPGVIVYPEPIAVGDEIDVCAYTDNSFGGLPYPVTDSLGNSFTCTAAVTTPGIANITLVYMCYSHATVAGYPDTLSAGPFALFGAITAARFSNLSGVIDGSISTATTSGTTSVQGLTTTPTTTVNGSLMANCTGAGGINNRTIIPGDNEFLAQDPSQGRVLLTQAHTTTLGVQSQTNYVWGFGATFGMITQAFKPSPSIYLSDTALHDASAGVAYSAQLHGIGGIAPLNYACTGLPANGCSLAGATGVISCATPTAGTLSLSCTVDDGSTTSSADVLSLKIGSSAFATPAIRSYVGNPNVVAGNFDSGTTLTVYGVGCDDNLTLTLTGDDRGNGEGFLQATSGTYNYIQDSWGSPVTRISPHGGAYSSPLVSYRIGPIRHTGTDVITVVNNQAASSGNEALVVDWQNVQGIIDYGAIASNMYTSGATLNTSLPTVVPNEMGVATSMYAHLLGAYSTFSIAAPFTNVNLSGDLLVADALISSPGTTTAAVSFTSPNALDALTSNVFSLRPALASTCPSLIRHRSWFQQ